VNSTASIGRKERSAVGDHFGWHPSTGPDVDERDGHVFVNNLLTAGENYHRSPVQKLRTGQLPAAAVISRISGSHPDS
jgi:hypothetical protein